MEQAITDIPCWQTVKGRCGNLATPREIDPQGPAEWKGGGEHVSGAAGDG